MTKKIDAPKSISISGTFPTMGFPLIDPIATFATKAMTRIPATKSAMSSPLVKLTVNRRFEINVSAYIFYCKHLHHLVYLQRLIYSLFENTGAHVT